MLKLRHIAAIALLLATGCSVGQPNLLHPGPAWRQQRRAAIFDPFADEDVGPEVVGARPRDFQKPIENPDRRHFRRGTWWGR